MKGLTSRGGVLRSLRAPAFAQNAPKPRTRTRAAMDDPHAGHAMEMQQAAPAAAPGPRNPNLPPTGDAPGDKYSGRQGAAVVVAAPRRLGRHQGEQRRRADQVVHRVPGAQDKAPVVIVIQEIFGLTDWIRGVADQLAKEGFIAIAP